MFFIRTIVLIVSLALAVSEKPGFAGNPASALLAEWNFTPAYSLEREAFNIPGVSDEEDESTPPMILPPYLPPFQWFGESPTGGKYNLIEKTKIPKDAFTIEMWMLHHVDKPVGVLIGPASLEQGKLSGWLLGMYDKTFYFGVSGVSGAADMKLLSSKVSKGFHKWLYHVVGTYNGESLCFYMNGKLVQRDDNLHGSVYIPADATLNALVYMKNESFMELGNLVRNVWLYNRALDEKEISERFRYVSEAALDGRFLQDKLHFTAGPILQMVKQNQATLLWETDRPASARIEYGKRRPADHSIETSTQSRLHEMTLPDLDASSPYFYRITATGGNETINSGWLTFQTAIKENEPLTFAVLADTEARPQIANRIAKQIWAERPHFAVINGDLTDGGQKENRFEWVYEYFASMTQLWSRIPSYPAVGNGEDDKVWFSYYHALPPPENYYTFSYGDVQFFMLDSNQDMGPGSEQYQWLENELLKSKAVWKFAAHHHPTYSGDEDDYGDTYEEPSTFGDANVRKILPLYEKYHIDIVWYGHMHYYERTWPIRDGQVDLEKGTIHIQTGGAGGNFEEISPTRPWFTYSVLRDYHYCIVHVFGNHLDFKMMDIYGNIRDQFSLSK